MQEEKHMRAKIILAGLLLTACSPRVIERVRTVTVTVPVAAPCPLPADVLPRPVKPSDPLPDDAVKALAIVTGYAVQLDAWADVVAGQVAACSGVNSSSAPSPG